MSPSIAPDGHAVLMDKFPPVVLAVFALFLTAILPRPHTQDRHSSKELWRDLWSAGFIKACNKGQHAAQVAASGVSERVFSSNLLGR